MRNNIKVSIVVPVYNVEKYIRECIESLIAQTCKDIEIICVDDGSTDKSGVILDEYANLDNRVHVIHQYNKGLAEARNAGMENARGEYVGFVDGDDKIDQHYCEKMYNLGKRRKADIVVSDILLFPENTKTHKKVWYQPIEGKLKPVQLYRNIQPSNKLTSLDLVRKNNFRFVKNDSYYKTLMLNAKNICSVSEKLYHYRVGHKSMSTTYKMQSFIDSVDTAMVQRENLRNTSKEEEFGEYFEFTVIHNLILAMIVASLNNNREVFVKYRRNLRQLKYKNNKYLKLCLGKDYGGLKYFVIVNIFPLNYGFAKLLTKVGLK